ncbi:MAG: hypothetical protein GY760_24105, partial [Deltaproteobacteria bacterium]|nr:hypothetical protein [Deltaproteobacteria bacterium]
GGTWSLLNQEKDHFNMRGSVINLKTVDELKRINRTDRYLELGSTVTISKVLDLGKSIVPKALYSALKEIGPPQIRNMATIGGNLCISNRSMDLFPILNLLDTQIELRKHKDLRSRRKLLRRDSRWIPTSRFINNEGETILTPGEIVSRIRIPNENWAFQTYTKIEGISSLLVFLGLATTDKYTISDFKISFSTSRERIIRNRELEADLVGRRIPLTRKEFNQINIKLTETFQNFKETDFTAARAIALTKHFIEEISDPVEEEDYF